MKVIIVQGIACVGKTTLCRELEDIIDYCRQFTFDDYKEELWDEFGFDSAEERERLTNQAMKIFYKDIDEAVKSNMYDFILIDYAFKGEQWTELLKHIKTWKTTVDTIYLKPIDLTEHQKAWKERSKNFDIRHAGHNAKKYHNGVGEGYTGEYDSSDYNRLPTYGKVLEINVSYYPYLMDSTYDDILYFVGA